VVGAPSQKKLVHLEFHSNDLFGLDAPLTRIVTVWLSIRCRVPEISWVPGNGVPGYGTSSTGLQRPKQAAATATAIRIIDVNLIFVIYLLFRCYYLSCCVEMQGARPRTSTRLSKRAMPNPTQSSQNSAVRTGSTPANDALPFGRLWYGEPNAISNAVDYAKSTVDHVMRSFAFTITLAM
jgi:hypothetical protein